MSQQRRELTVTCVRRDLDAGYWTARVTLAGGRTYNVDRLFGSWRVTPRRGANAWREVGADIAAALQARVRPLERREQRAGKQDEVAA